MEQSITNNLDLFDPSNKRSMINIVQEGLAEEIKKIPPDLLTKKEKALRERVKPDLITQRLRLSFWNEYTRAQDSIRNMKSQNIYEGICSHSFFYHVVIKNPLQLAWIIRPPVDYDIALKASLFLATEQIAEVINEAKLVDEKGKMDSKAVAIMLEINKFLHAVVKGSIVQRIESKALNVNVDANGNSRDVSQMSMEELQKVKGENKKLIDQLKRGIVDVNSKD